MYTDNCTGALCVPRSPETFADCGKSYTKPWSVNAMLKIRKKDSIKAALCVCVWGGGGVELSYFLRMSREF